MLWILVQPPEHGSDSQSTSTPITTADLNPQPSIPVEEPEESQPTPSITTIPTTTTIPTATTTATTPSPSPSPSGNRSGPAANTKGNLLVNNRSISAPSVSHATGNAGPNPSRFGGGGAPVQRGGVAPTPGILLGE